MSRIVAIVGMCGSGKSVACEYFENKGYQKVYFGGVTMDKLKENNLEVTPENEKMMREKLRQEYGMGAYATLLLPKIKELSLNGNVILDGLYSWEELKILNEFFDNKIEVVSIITNKQLRYERLSVREVRPLTKEEARNRDIAEIENVQKGGPIAYADYFVINNGTVDELYVQLDKIFN